jgi:hypothetical protein
LAVVAACSFQHGVGSDGAPPMIDGSGSGSDASTGDCVGGGLAKICLRTPVMATWTVGSATTFDTGADCDYTLALASGTVCVKQATDVSISDTLGVTGALPLVIVADHMLAVTGTIDVSSARGAPGPGADDMACAAGSAGGTEGSNNPTAGGGGGAGGSFTGAGGAGSAGSRPGGMPGTTIAASSLHGGCIGTHGGNQQNHKGGAPGDGGGAVYLIAGDTIAIDGAIDASGGGGGGGDLKAGGGGGGSGGMIGLDAAHVRVSAGAQVFANGGGGGEGGDASNVGADGGESMQATSAAAGGSGSTSGGDGGDGAAGTALTGSAGNPRSSGGGGGGGGGGGAGAIRVFSPDAMLAGAVSPAAS